MIMKDKKKGIPNAYEKESYIVQRQHENGKQKKTRYQPQHDFLGICGQPGDAGQYFCLLCIFICMYISIYIYITTFFVYIHTYIDMHILVFLAMYNCP